MLHNFRKEMYSEYKGLVNKTTCSRCGYNEFELALHIHHLDEDSTNNAPENLIVLCANCHAGLHKKLWNLEDIAITKQVNTPHNLITRICFPAKTISETEFTLLINTCKATPPKLTKGYSTQQYIIDRDVLLLTLLYKTGINISGLLGLKSEDIDINRNLIQCKLHGGKTVNLLLTNEIKEIILKYIEKYKIQSFIFENYLHSKKAMTRQNVNKKLKILATQAGLSQINPRSFDKRLRFI